MLPYTQDNADCHDGGFKQFLVLCNLQLGKIAFCPFYLSMHDEQISLRWGAIGSLHVALLTQTTVALCMAMYSQNTDW
jgi:hypothetical protein